MIAYKIDVLETLKEAGYNTTRLRKEKLLNESAIQYLRDGKPVGRSTPAHFSLYSRRQDRLWKQKSRI